MTPSVRLFAILARKAPVSVVFRRGPSKHVLLVLWRTDTDTFFRGQWFKGRIYERRCDLSPSGKKLIYFAANWRGPYHSWTAVSRPPFLTAVALWPKGDAWGGGGVFVKEKSILLNGQWPTDLAEGFRVPKSVTISVMEGGDVRKEGFGIWDQRLTRDGWEVGNEGRAPGPREDVGLRTRPNPPASWEKPSPASGCPWLLRMAIAGIGVRGGPWYVMEHTLVHKRPGFAVPVGRTDWADWDRNGDLLFAQGGGLYRLTIPDADGTPTVSEARLLVDLSGETFRNVEAPEAAKDWFADVPLDEAALRIE